MATVFHDERPEGIMQHGYSYYLPLHLVDWPRELEWTKTGAVTKITA